MLLPLVEWVVISELLLYGICDPLLPHVTMPTLAPSDLPEGPRTVRDERKDAWILLQVTLCRYQSVVVEEALACVSQGFPQRDCAGAGVGPTCPSLLLAGAVAPLHQRAVMAVRNFI